MVDKIKVKAAMDFDYDAFFWGESKDIGKKMIRFNKGDDIPDALVERLLMRNPEHLDVEWKHGNPIDPRLKKIKDEAVKKVEEEKKSSVTKKYTETELYDLGKAEQVELLERYGVSSSEIVELRIEPNRVKRLLELQK